MSKVKDLDKRIGERLARGVKPVSRLVDRLRPFVKRKPIIR